MSETPFVTPLVESYYSTDEVVSEVGGRTLPSNDRRRRGRNESLVSKNVDTYTAEDLVLQAVRKLTDDMSHVWFRDDGSATVYNSADARRRAQRLYLESIYRNPDSVTADTLDA